jgi:hypothetical protein
MPVCLVTEKQLREFEEKGEKFQCEICKQTFKEAELVMRRSNSRGKTVYFHLSCSSSKKLERGDLIE